MKTKGTSILKLKTCLKTLELPTSKNTQDKTSLYTSFNLFWSSISFSICSEVKSNVRLMISTIKKKDKNENYYKSLYLIVRWSCPTDVGCLYSCPWWKTNMRKIIKNILIKSVILIVPSRFFYCYLNCAVYALSCCLMPNTVFL